jgi:hypothetical protein
VDDLLTLLELSHLCDPKTDAGAVVTFGLPDDGRDSAASLRPESATSNKEEEVRNKRSAQEMKKRKQKRKSSKSSMF